MNIDIQQVKNSNDIKAFHKLPFQIYEDYPHWMPSLQSEVEQIFDRKKNPFFQTGECERYLVNDGSKVVGRFAVMNQPGKDKVLEPTMAGLGFVELYDDAQIFGEIITYASEWHKQRGYRAMRGPVNFSENDTYWGLLVENYDDPPIYGMHYHPPYYKRLFENSGAEKLDNHLTYAFRFKDPLPERLIRISNRIKAKDAVEIRQIDTGNLYRDAQYIREIYNSAWANQSIKEREEEFTELTKETVYNMVDELKPILMKEAVPIILVNGEPASFIVSVPNINELSNKTGGRLRWWNLWRLLFFKRQVRRLRVLALGTKPEFRNRGLEALGFVEGIRWVRRAYPNLEMLEGAWVSENNWLMRRSLEALGCFHHKTHRTYYWEF